MHPERYDLTQPDPTLFPFRPGVDRVREYEDKLRKGLGGQIQAVTCVAGSGISKTQRRFFELSRLLLATARGITARRWSLGRLL